MSDSDLRNLLTQLHARLGSAHTLDTEDRRLLTTALVDIEKALTMGEPTQQPGAPDLETFAVKFEAGHPALAETLRRVVDALGKAGI